MVRRDLKESKRSSFFVHALFRRCPNAAGLVHSRPVSRGGRVCRVRFQAMTHAYYSKTHRRVRMKIWR